MKNHFARLCVFFSGFPLCIAIIFLLPYKNHLAANLLVSLLSAFGAVELAGILRKKDLDAGKAQAFCFGLLPPLSVTAMVSFNLPLLLPLAVFTLLAAWILVSALFIFPGALERHIGRIAAGFTLLFYPASLICWIIMINRLPHASYLLAFFISLVIVTDSLGWTFGVLFGKGNRGIIAVSPNKSVAGYAGSFLGASGLSAVAGYFLPELFAASRVPAAAPFIAGIVTALASQAGDIAESAIKRSAGVKDSGSIMPGRGGILDSIDSLAFSAPFFYFTFIVLYS